MPMPSPSGTSATIGKAQVDPLSNVANISLAGVTSHAVNVSHSVIVNIQEDQDLDQDPDQDPDQDQDQDPALDPALDQDQDQDLDPDLDQDLDLDQDFPFLIILKLQKTQ